MEEQLCGDHCFEKLYINVTLLKAKWATLFYFVAFSLDSNAWFVQVSVPVDTGTSTLVAAQSCTNPKKLGAHLKHIWLLILLHKNKKF